VALAAVLATLAAAVAVEAQFRRLGDEIASGGRVFAEGTIGRTMIDALAENMEPLWAGYQASGRPVKDGLKQAVKALRGAPEDESVAIRDWLLVLALAIAGALHNISPDIVQAARSLGASPWHAFWRVVWPLSLPGVFAAFLLTFVPATGDYVNSTLLGGPSTTMIGNIIQEKFLVELDYPEAAALSVILMIVMLVLATVYARVLGTEDVQRAAGAQA